MRTRVLLAVLLPLLLVCLAMTLRSADGTATGASAAAPADRYACGPAIVVALGGEPQVQGELPPDLDSLEQSCRADARRQALPAAAWAAGTLATAGVLLAMFAASVCGARRREPAAVA